MALGDKKEEVNPRRPSQAPVVPAGRRGRRPLTSPAQLERAAFDLFDRQGFEVTTVEDIAAAVGVSRRTFFRYFDSKNDVVWGGFSDQLTRMRQCFAACPPDQPVMDAVRCVVVDFNRFDPAEVPWHRKRMELILKVPALQAHSTLRYQEWREVVAEFVGDRMGAAHTDLLPRAVAYAALGVAVAGYENWLEHPASDLATVLDQALRSLGQGFALQ